MRKMALLLILILLAGWTLPALAEEEIPLLGEPQLLIPHESWGKTRTVYAHPTEFTPGIGKVGFAGEVWCYGYVENPYEWDESKHSLSLLIRYEKDSGGERIGWLTDVKPEEIAGQGLPGLTFADGEIIDLFGLRVTDDPYGKQTKLGRMVGEGQVAAYLDDLWAYVSGDCELDGESYEWPAMGFVLRSELEVQRAADLMLPHLDKLHLFSAIPLELRETVSDLQVYPLSAHILIAYHREESDKLWLRVVSYEGDKIFVKSVPEKEPARITVTEDGFICECFDDANQDSGTRYTYRWTGKVGKMSSEKIKGVSSAPEQTATPSRLVPDNLPIPAACTVTSLGEGEDGFIYLAVNTGEAGLLCAVSPDGTLYHLSDMGQEIIWVSEIGSYGIFHVICRTMDSYELMGFSVILYVHPVQREG